MKAYLTTTGAVFGLLTVVHLWRMIAIEPREAKDPLFIFVTLLAAGLCLWACRLLWVASRR